MTSQPHDTPTPMSESELLAEDADERRMFDAEVERYGGNSVMRIADALAIFSKVQPANGSFSKSLAIYSNTLRTAASTQASPSPAGREALREEIARIIDRGGWQTYDYWKQHNPPGIPLDDKERRRHLELSIRHADAILALPGLASTATSRDDTPAGQGGRRSAYWTYDTEAAKDIGEHLYYFAPTNRAPPPYKTQRRVTAIIDIAADGTLAGVELIDGMPAPPLTTHDAHPLQERGIPESTAENNSDGSYSNSMKNGE